MALWKRIVTRLTLKGLAAVRSRRRLGWILVLLIGMCLKGCLMAATPALGTTLENALCEEGRPILESVVQETSARGIGTATPAEGQTLIKHAGHQVIDLLHRLREMGCPRVLDPGALPQLDGLGSMDRLLTTIAEACTEEAAPVLARTTIEGRCRTALAQALARYDALHTAADPTYHAPLEPVLLVEPDEVYRHRRSLALAQRVFAQLGVGETESIAQRLTRVGESLSFPIYAHALKRLFTPDCPSEEARTLWQLFTAVDTYGVRHETPLAEGRPLGAQVMMASDVSQMVPCVLQAVDTHRYPEGSKSLEVLLRELSALHPEQPEALTQLGETARSVQRVYYGFPTGPPLPEGGPICSWTLPQVSAWAVDARRVGRPDPTVCLAVLNRAAELTLAQFPQWPQQLAVISLLQSPEGQGRVFEIATGEGKTLTTALMAAALALQGLTVDVISSSEVLAERDGRGLKPFYEALGLSVGLARDGAPQAGEGDRDGLRLPCYQKDLVYGSMLELQGDDLRSRYHQGPGRGDRPFGAVLSDEVDSALVDGLGHATQLSSHQTGMEALQPIITALWTQLMALAQKLVYVPKAGAWVYVDGAHQIINGELHVMADLPEARVQRVEDPETFQREVLTRCVAAAVREGGVPIPVHVQGFVAHHTPVWVDAALRAGTIRENVDYVCAERDGRRRILPGDKDTGVVQERMQWSEGMHQFLQLRHGLALTSEGLTNCYVSNLTFVRRYHGHVYGLTGTLGDAATQTMMQRVYGVDVWKIPTFRPKRFTLLPGQVVATDAQWRDAIIGAVQAQRARGRACLVLCATIAAVDQVAEALRASDPGLRPQCYARSDDPKEQTVITGTLGVGDVIVATNLAGRGTDLGLTKEVLAQGGLHVCVTFLPRNARVEAQALGRTARKGEPGSGEFLVRASDAGLLEGRALPTRMNALAIQDPNDYTYSSDDMARLCQVYVAGDAEATFTLDGAEVVGHTVFRKGRTYVLPPITAHGDVTPETLLAEYLAGFLAHPMVQEAGSEILWIPYNPGGHWVVLQLQMPAGEGTPMTLTYLDSLAVPEPLAAALLHDLSDRFHGVMGVVQALRGGDRPMHLVRAQGFLQPDGVACGVVAIEHLKVLWAHGGIDGGLLSPEQLHGLRATHRAALAQWGEALDADPPQGQGAAMGGGAGGGVSTALEVPLSTLQGQREAREAKRLQQVERRTVPRLEREARWFEEVIALRHRLKAHADDDARLRDLDARWAIELYQLRRQADQAARSRRAELKARVDGYGLQATPAGKGVNSVYQAVSQALGGTPTATELKALGIRTLLGRQATWTKAELRTFATQYHDSCTWSCAHPDVIVALSHALGRSLIVVTSEGIALLAHHPQGQDRVVLSHPTPDPEAADTTEGGPWFRVTRRAEHAATAFGEALTTCLTIRGTFPHRAHVTEAQVKQVLGYMRDADDAARRAREATRDYQAQVRLAAFVAAMERDYRAGVPLLGATGNLALQGFQGTSEAALTALTEAIQRDPIYACGAYYRRAIVHIQQQRSEYKALAVGDLQAAKASAAEVRATWQAMSTLTGGNPQQELTHQLNGKIAVLTAFMTRMDQHVQQIRACKAKNRIVVSDFNDLSNMTAMKGCTKADLAEFQAAGLRGLYELVEREPPTDWGSVFALVLLGGIQIAVGAAVAVFTGGTLGTGLISSGIGDIWSAIKCAVQGGEYDWEKHCLQKGITFVMTFARDFGNAVAEHFGWGTQAASQVEGEAVIVGATQTTVVQETANFSLKATLVDTFTTTATQIAIHETTYWAAEKMVAACTDDLQSTLTTTVGGYFKAAAVEADLLALWCVDTQLGTLEHHVWLLTTIKEILKRKEDLVTGLVKDLGQVISQIAQDRGGLSPAAGGVLKLVFTGVHATQEIIAVRRLTEEVMTAYVAQVKARAAGLPTFKAVLGQKLKAMAYREVMSSWEDHLDLAPIHAAWVATGETSESWSAITVPPELCEDVEKTLLARKLLSHVQPWVRGRCQWDPATAAKLGAKQVCTAPVATRAQVIKGYMSGILLLKTIAQDLADPVGGRYFITSVSDYVVEALHLALTQRLNGIVGSGLQTVTNVLADAVLRDQAAAAREAQIKAAEAQQEKLLRDGKVEVIPPKAPTQPWERDAPDPKPAPQAKEMPVKSKDLAGNNAAPGSPPSDASAPAAPVAVPEIMVDEDGQKWVKSITGDYVPYYTAEDICQMDRGLEHIPLENLIPIRAGARMVLQAGKWVLQQWKAHETLEKTGGPTIESSSVTESETSVTVVHGNSLSSTKPTHIYKIMKGDGSLYKVGESGQGLNKVGLSQRAEEQVSKLNRENPGADFKSKILRTYPDKAAARQFETKLIEMRKSGNPAALPGNKTNR